ncbi:hypothetical protein SAMN05428970_0661 [Agromyces sp. CF514]|uniref:hypothetical protein n=1 Tax=Agromyces sp. CF514 TaxID=1881031 RepID=UPI0008F083DD|nr:hypothetical protein [Agromyces sp. CF514]SFR69317.1 hypothetical protein SAMN05428970_0661 [Agromyces sp. CF514]
MEPGIVFALAWAVLALVGGVLLVVRRRWLADTITAERQSTVARAGARGPSPRVFLIVGLVFAAMGLFIIVWWASAAL